MPVHMVVILNLHTNLVFGLHYHCCDWLNAIGPVTSILSTSLKIMGPAYNWANICSILTMHTSQMSMNLYRSKSFHNMKFNHHPSPVCMSNIYHFALLLCWMNMTSWSTGDPSWAGQCHHLVGKVRNYPVPHLKEEQHMTHYYHTDLCTVSWFGRRVPVL